MQIKRCGVVLLCLVSGVCGCGEDTTSDLSDPSALKDGGIGGTAGSGGSSDGTGGQPAGAAAAGGTGGGGGVSGAGSSGASGSAGTGGSQGGAAGTPGDELPSTLHDYLGAEEDRELVSGLMAERFTITPPTRIIYAAPPSGTLDGNGTQADPRRDLKGALEAAEPGDHFYLAPGVYPMSTVRDTFGYAGSLVFLSASATRDHKIVVRTDPALYDPASGQVAQIDFGFENSWPNHRTFSFSLSGDEWILQDLEIRNMQKSGIWLTGTNNLIRNCEIHHANHDGNNNFGLIVAATQGATFNLVMGNHLHHSGELGANGDIIGFGGSNGGCTYSETRQGYESDFSAITSNSTRAEVDAAKNPADSDVYYYNNLVHHCHNGIATKNNSEGPFYVLSNVIHDAGNGIKITLAHSVVRNNIIYAGDHLDNGILVGWSASSGPLSQLYHGVNMTVRNNTVIGANKGTAHYAGWNLQMLDNVFVDVPDAHRILRNSYAWYPSSWPGVVGEWAYADLTASHPYYDFMPRYLRDMAGSYHSVASSGNVYPATPALSVNVESEFYDLEGTTLSDDYTVVDSATLRAHMRDPSNHDYRRDPTNPGPLTGVGSGIR